MARSLPSRMKGLAHLFLKGLPRLARAAATGRPTGWWRWDLWQLALGHGYVIANVIGTDPKPGQKRALLCYVVAPFLLDESDPLLRKHTNRWRALEIARILTEMGYVVDVMDHDDQCATVRRTYDLLIGQGRACQLAEEFGPATQRVFLGTTPPAWIQNERIQQRTAETAARRSCPLVERRLQVIAPEDLGNFDALACLGTRANAALYAEAVPGTVHAWHNHAWDDLVGPPPGKDYGSARRRFLFFGSKGMILGGLDLVLEAFARRPDLDLHVCGHVEREQDVVSCFHKELFETPNIHLEGWVPVGSERFRELVRDCGTVVAPVCAVSSHGSVIVCMGSGLVPLAPPEVAGFDTESLGTTLGELTVEAVGELVDRVSTWPAERMERHSNELVARVQRDFSQARFGERFREILREILIDQGVERGC